MDEYLVVDGYNVINAWPELIALKDISWEHARDRLIDTLANYRAAKGLQVIVVFDAHQVKGGTQKSEVISGVEVIYTGEGETADAVIEKLIGRLPKGSRVSVVTSDWAEQRIVMGKGALRVPAREFYLEVKRMENEMRKYFAGKNKEVSSLDAHLGDNIKAVLEKWRRRK